MPLGLKLDALINDIVFTDGALVTVTDAEEIARNIKTRLRMNQGEYVYDNTYGFPYNTALGSKIFNIGDLEVLIKQYILETVGVTQLTRFNLDFLRGNQRKLLVDFTVSTVFGRFIVEDAFDTLTQQEQNNVWNI